jgi:hypothetical protein
MASAKHINGLCHNIAHHAVSGLSFINPHILAASRAAGVDYIAVNLLDSNPCPPQFWQIKPLRLSLRTLREKFEHMLEGVGFSVADLNEAQLIFCRAYPDADDYCAMCHAKITLKTGCHFEHLVDYLGNHHRI